MVSFQKPWVNLVVVDTSQASFTVRILRYEIEKGLRAVLWTHLYVLTHILPCSVADILIAVIIFSPHNTASVFDYIVKNFS